MTGKIIVGVTKEEVVAVVAAEVSLVGTTTEETGNVNVSDLEDMMMITAAGGVGDHLADAVVMTDSMTETLVRIMVTTLVPRLHRPWEHITLDTGPHRPPLIRRLRQPR